MEQHAASFEDMRGRFAAVGVTLSISPDKSFSASRNRVPIFTFAFDPPRAEWGDPHLEAFLRSVLEYEEAARALQQNRGPSTFGLRAVLRDRLEVAALLNLAREARVGVDEKKHLTTKDIYFDHPAFGKFVRVTVLRGQSHVVAVMFSTPEDRLAVTYPLGITDVCRSGIEAGPPPSSKAKARTRAPDLMDQFDDRPLPTTQEEADALLADIISAGLGRRVEARPLGPVETPTPALLAPQRLIVNADGTASFTMIGAALAAAADGDEVLVRPGDYSESLVIDKSVTIRGDGPRDRIVVRPTAREEPCISITANAPRISGLTIIGLDLPNRDDAKPAALIQVSGGAPVLEDLDVAGGDFCISMSGPETSGAIRSCAIHDAKSGGIVVIKAASPRIEENDVWGNAEHGVAIKGAGTDPLVRANNVHDGNGFGILVGDGASPRIEENDVWGNAGVGIIIGDAGTDPLVRANRVHNGKIVGIVVANGASPRIEGNDVWGNAYPGMMIGGSGTDPLVQSNRVHDGENGGIVVQAGASPRIEENEVWGNVSAGIAIDGAETDPVVRANRVHDGQSDGILVQNGASPRVEENEVWGNARGMMISGIGTDPLVRANRVHDGQGDGIDARMGACPRIERNEVWGNAAAGIWISDAGTAPLVLANRVHDGMIVGIAVADGASPRIEENEVWGNAHPGIGISGAGTNPLVRNNRVHDGQSYGLVVQEGASPRIEENEVWGNAHPGIGISGAGTKPVITLNRLHGNGREGISVLDGATPVLSGNVTG